MTEFAATSQFLSELYARGYVYQATDAAGLDEEAGKDKPLTAYVGYDATADSLHVGSLVSIMMLRRLQKAGGKPIVLMGGGTTKVGDPTDKEKSRPLLTDAQIAANIAGIKKAFERYLTFGDGPTDAVMVNNADWLDRIGYIEFLRDIGRHFTVNTMVKQDTVARRLKNEQPYTFLEFNYMLLQSYDFLELNRRHGCALQMGGSDQWGNIINGVELCRKVEGNQAFGLTTPLVTTASGAKMGKTVDGAVWLNAEKRTPFEYWQFWRNTEDADVGRFLKLFTDLPLDEIARLEALEGAEINSAKIVLANEATTLLHGAEAARAAEEGARAVFTAGQSADSLPTVEISRAEVDAGLQTAPAFVRAGLAASNGEVRGHMKANAAKIDGTPVNDPMAPVTLADFDAEGGLRLSIGKKRHARLKLSD